MNVGEKAGGGVWGGSLTPYNAQYVNYQQDLDKLFSNYPFYWCYFVILAPS